MLDRENSGVGIVVRTGDVRLYEKLTSSKIDDSVEIFGKKYWLVGSSFTQDMSSTLYNIEFREVVELPFLKSSAVDCCLEEK